MKYLYTKLGIICLIALLIGFIIGFAVGVKQTISWGVDLGLKIMNRYGYDFSAYSVVLKQGIYQYQNQIGGCFENASLYAYTGNKTRN